MRLLTLLFRWMTGYYAVSVGGRDLIDAVTVMMKRSIAYRNLKLNEKEGTGTFLIPRKGYRELVRVFGPRADSVVILREYGLPALLRRYRKRPGIAVGTLLFFSLCFLSERFLWDIDVTGNETISDVEVLETLSSLGCSIGTPIWKVDFFAIGNEYLCEEPRASFAAVNLEGTTVHVVIREKKKAAEKAAAHGPSNLVSTVNGRVVLPEVISGQLLVKEGDVVTEGQLLVSGVMTKRGDESGVFRLERSEGRIFAEWETEVYAEIPLSRTVTTEKSRRTVEKTVIIFGKPIKILKNSRNSGAKYDIIEERERGVLFGFLRLPLYIVTAYETERAEKKITLTPSEAEEEAERALSQAILKKVGDGELVRTEKNVERKEDCVTARAKLTVVTDIAVEVPITVLP